MVVVFCWFLETRDTVFLFHLHVRRNIYTRRCDDTSIQFFGVFVHSDAVCTPTVQHAHDSLILHRYQCDVYSYQVYWLNLSFAVNIGRSVKMKVLFQLKFQLICLIWLIFLMIDDSTLFHGRAHIQNLHSSVITHSFTALYTENLIPAFEIYFLTQAFPEYDLEYPT